MPEGGGSNVEVAEHLSHSHHHEGPQSRSHEILEIIEAIVLATVAITTAWSGYQAALWTGHQSELYGIASKLRIEASAASTAANQQRIYNAATVAEWLRAEAEGQTKLAAIFERRFLPEFRPAFEAWKQTDPLNNPNAPAGPQLMSEYHSSRTEQAIKFDEEATETFEKGNLAREHSDEYVRVTVGLATVLLLMAISQRFKFQAVRAGLAAVATLLLILPVWRILMLPRA